jgi:hypothetical protein
MKGKCDTFIIYCSQESCLYLFIVEKVYANKNKTLFQR